MPWKSEHPSAKLADGRVEVQQVLRGTGPKAAQELRLDDGQLGVEILAAIGRFVGQRRAVLRRPATEDVHDVNVLAAELHAFGDDVGEQLTGPADKRFALPIFVRAGGLADKDQLGMRIADAEDGLLASGRQDRAARAGGHPFGHFGQGLLTRCGGLRAWSRERGAGERGSGGAGERGRKGRSSPLLPFSLSPLLPFFPAPRPAAGAPPAPRFWPWECATGQRREGFPASASRPGECRLAIWTVLAAYTSLYPGTKLR